MALNWIKHRTKRRPNFSPAEIETLVECLEKNRDVQDDKFPFSDLQAWKEITRRVNMVSSVQRNNQEIMSKWRDLRCKTRLKIVRSKKMKDHLSDLERRIDRLGEIYDKQVKRTSRYKILKKYRKESEPAEQESIPNSDAIEIDDADKIESIESNEKSDYQEKLDSFPCSYPITMSSGEIEILMQQQELLLKQQGQMLTVLEELRDIQRDLLMLKQKNHELKLSKFQFTAAQAGIKIVTISNQ
ncbi:uncharacterized protein [Centruroides vittatus]|uniref:uncharacterized protein n=1 Tax=Centruroides vittatus TaxID=120091 RepID=UPI0035106E97